MCENFHHLSPYLFYGNDPVNKVDPTGKIIELPRGSTTEQILTVMWNVQQITDDKLVFNTQKDGSIRIKIASLGEGGHTYYETIRLEESATIGLDYNETGDITENDIRKEHGLPLRGGYGNKRVY